MQLILDWFCLCRKSFFCWEKSIRGSDPFLRGRLMAGLAGPQLDVCVWGGRCFLIQMCSQCILQCSAEMLLAVKNSWCDFGRCWSQAEQLCPCPEYVTVALALLWASHDGPRADIGLSPPWINSPPKKIWGKVSCTSPVCTFYFAKKLAWEACGKTPRDLEVALALKSRV